MRQYDWKSEASLDPEIQPQRQKSAQTTNQKHVFLTGATGFLGAYLLNELLHTTDANIYCLVRSDDSINGAQRIHGHLERLGIADSIQSHRIIPVIGNLARPLFGLSIAEFHDLANRIDTIYHSGVSASFLQSYSALKETNVLGTQEVLRLAALGTTQSVHYVSTLALFLDHNAVDNICISELAQPTLHPGLRNGYLQSKWVAEQLVLAARERGISSSMYRTSRITGHSRTGATSNSRDLLNCFLKGCILLRAYPRLTIELSMAPVDYISRAIVHLSNQSQSWGRNYHLLNPEPIEWSAFLPVMREMGYKFVELDYPYWLAKLKKATMEHVEHKSLAQLWMLLHSPHHLFSRRLRHQLPNSSEWLTSCGLHCPPIDATILKNYIAFFQKTGFIPQADAMNAC